MHVSIWQQFASNHSASFTVVGEFQDAHAAHSAADIVRKVAKSIADWYSVNKTIQDAVIQRTQETPTPAELQACQEYGISCERALDWLANCGYSENIVRIYDNCVFVTNLRSCEGWAGEALFDQLMAKLAIKTFIDEENSRATIVTVTGIAPDVATAQSIHDAAATYLVLMSGEFNMDRDIPWMETYLRKEMQGDETLRDYGIYLARRRAETQWDETNKGQLEKLFEQAGIDSSKWPPPAEVQQIQLEFRKMKQRDLSSIEEIDLYRQLPVTHAIAEVGAHIPWWSNGGVEVNDLRIALRGIFFSNISVGLPIVVEWLAEQGCTDISYQFEQH